MGSWRLFGATPQCAGSGEDDRFDNKSIYMSNIVKMKMSTNPRLLNDVLTLYKSTFYALKELIDNSIQAKAKRVEVNLIPSSCSEDSLNYKRIEIIEVVDNGEGVPFSNFESSIMQIATENKTEGQCDGRLGALQIGQEVRIETVAYDTIKKINDGKQYPVVKGFAGGGVPDRDRRTK